MHLWYRQHARNWNEALPLGDGHFGAMVYGNVENELIKLNEETVWYRGHEKDRNNPDSLKYLPDIRNLLMENKISEAEKLAKLAMFSTPRDQSHYEYLGELFINQDFGTNAFKIEEYYRGLDLQTAVISASYKVEKTVFKREYFVSHTDNALIIKYSSSEAGKLNLNIQLGRQKRFNDAVWKFDDSGIIMQAHAGGEKGTAFQVGCKALCVDGQIEVIGETIVCRDNTEVVLAVTSSTDYWTPQGEKACEEKLENLDISDHALLKERHIAKYQELFNRVALSLDQDEKSTIPTDMRLESVKRGESDNGLIQLYFDYGRYLLISSSNPKGLPSNLQGLWSEDVDPIWGSKYTININTQMNYWLTGPCDLAEVELPLFEMLEKMRPNGRITAQKMYGARGFTAHHNTDGFYDTTPQSHAIGAAIWPMTVPWLCCHIWEHFEYTQDKAFLGKYFSIFEEALAFYEDYLFEYRGHLVTGPSVSPENKYRTQEGVEGNLCLSPTIDNQILRFFLSCLVNAARTLEKSDELIRRSMAIYERLPKTKIGRHGQIQEWLEDYEEVEPGHRHISPLFGLHPANEISLEKTPELAKAARKTIERRLKYGDYLEEAKRDQAINNWVGTGFVGSTRTGWSSAWLINFFARLQDGEAAVNELYGLLRNSTLINLLDDHPPFQIDGNFGAVNGICEMLVQSQNEMIELLPALPNDFASGYLKGFRVRGGQKIDVFWKDKKITKVRIEGRPLDNLKIRIKAENSLDEDTYQELVTLDKNGQKELSF
ncbi:glycoside hydrolase family 95 protein [Enterococcus avium]|uniref:glycoside hydrolase family 95 protein n=1 Tax=Enterococcus avium TaxID=33945 RepID=UPI00288CE497|nr:glycoside hydrolase family 95 protein [Enterococcus avium]MDT2565371.1 glycoside hydrolase family 95 protein [Enterococcus avium]